MQKSSFGKRMQLLREIRDLTQKEFSEFLEIPQPTLSQYENDRISPNMDVLIVLAQKCQVSIDWLCGMTPSISAVSDIVEFFYNLMDVAEISSQIKIGHNSAGIDFTYDDHQWHQTNKDICFTLGCIKKDLEALEAGNLSKTMFNMMRNRLIENYINARLTQKSLLTNDNVKSDYSIFNADERQLINEMSRGQPLSELTRERFLNAIEINKAVNKAVHKGDDMYDIFLSPLLEELKLTVTKITNDEWNNLIVQLPFPVSYNPYDEVNSLSDEERDRYIEEENDVDTSNERHTK